MPTRFNLLVATKVSKVSSFGLENDVITNEWALAACKIYVVWWWKPTCSHCNKSLIVMPIVLANSIFQNIHSTFDQFGLIPHSTENHPNPNPYSYQKIVQLSSVIISYHQLSLRFPPKIPSVFWPQRVPGGFPGRHNSAQRVRNAGEAWLTSSHSKTNLKSWRCLGWDQPTLGDKDSLCDSIFKINYYHYYHKNTMW